MCKLSYVPWNKTLQKKCLTLAPSLNITISQTPEMELSENKKIFICPVMMAHTCTYPSPWHRTSCSSKSSCCRRSTPFGILCELVAGINHEFLMVALASLSSKAASCISFSTSLTRVSIMLIVLPGCAHHLQIQSNASFNVFIECSHNL